MDHKAEAPTQASGIGALVAQELCVSLGSVFAPIVAVANDMARAIREEAPPKPSGRSG